MSCVRLTETSFAHKDLLFLGFNQDFTCFTCGTAGGFQIHNCMPYRETFKRDFPNGGIGIVEMLYRCNILALVGGGAYPCFPPNKVILWDDHQSQCIGELTFKTDVKGVRLRRDKIVVILENQVYVYNFDKLDPVSKYDTIANSKGIGALSSSNNCVLAIPAVQKGLVRVENFNTNKNIFIPAHENSISCLSLNADGSYLATASEKGTLIRIFKTATGEKIRELRRGSQGAEIFSLSFSPNSAFVVCSSDKGTIHIFSISDQAENRKSSLSVLSPVLPSIVNSEWSFAWYHVPGGEAPSIAAFASDPSDRTSVIVVSADGSYRKLLFDEKKGGECFEDDIKSFFTQRSEK